MDSFSPGMHGGGGLSGGGVDRIIEQSIIESDIDIITQMQPLKQRKQALERRLQTRRDPITLQSHGILPPPNTPPNYFAESQKLARCKTQDYLKRKILQRPDRRTLIQQHILEEVNVSPAMANNQKNLQRAQLVDQLNLKIAVRPGPIELIQRNILEADDGIKAAVLNGNVEYEDYEDEEKGSEYSSEDRSPDPPSLDPFHLIISKNHVEPNHSTRPVSRSEHSNRRPNSAVRQKKKINRSKFKFHVYTPNQGSNQEKINERRYDDYREHLSIKEKLLTTFKNENYENRMHQQKLLLEMDHLQQHIEHIIPKNETLDPSAASSSLSKVKGEVLILPSPTPSGDQLMHELGKRNHMFKSISPMPLGTPSAHNPGPTLEFSAPPPPPPFQIKSPPTPPPLEKLKMVQKIKFNPDNINDYKVKDLKSILRSYSLNVSGTKEVLIERILSHIRKIKPQTEPLGFNQNQPVKSEESKNRVALEMAQMKEKMENMQKIMEEQKREIQKLKWTGSEIGHPEARMDTSIDNMPTPSHFLAFKQGIKQKGFQLNRSDSPSPEIDVSMNANNGLLGRISAPVLYSGNPLDELMDLDHIIDADPLNSSNHHHHHLNINSKAHQNNSGVPCSIFDNTPQQNCNIINSHAHNSNFPQNILVNSNRFSDHDSGVNSQENLSDNFCDNSGVNILNPVLVSPKDLDWLGLESNDQFSRDILDPFSLIG